jgi:hypothetical protein
MAQAPGHRLGQIIGDTVELAIGPPLLTFAKHHELYLDKKGTRAARPGKKLVWRDSLGNDHDLDYVLERGGTDLKLGVPAAFIETAWRRYTKHSRNKAQEIQGAILPLLSTWAQTKPFAGVVLAGTWTEGSLAQLRSNGFSILLIPYDTIVNVFRNWDIDVWFEENTEDSILQQQIDRWESLGSVEVLQLADLLRGMISNDLKVFMDDLSKVVLRRVERVSVLVLRGRATECLTVGDAVDVIQSHVSGSHLGAILRFEIDIRYDNGDSVTAGFARAADAVAFVRSFV